MSPGGGTASALAVTSGDAQTFVAGVALPQPIAVRATDATGAPAPRVTVHFAVAAGGGSVSPDSVRTDSAGIASTVWTLGPTPGANRLTASANGVPSITAAATGVAAPLYGVIFGRIATGQRSSCALASSSHPDQGSTAYCWGSNTHGELGIGNLQQEISYNPVAVLGGSIYTAVVSAPDNDRACALTVSGPVVCWGSPVPSQGGADSIPTNVPGTADKTWVALSAGASFFCALDDAHDVWCWGEDRNGQLGDGTGIPSDTARLVAGGHAFTSIGSEVNESCALTADGQAWCWGANDLGNFSTDSSLAPVAVNTSVRFAQLSVGSVACGIDANGAAYCWGYNLLGQGGNGTTGLEPTPMPVSGGLTFRMVTAGSGFTCGIAAAGQAYCWGTNTVGELGDSTSSVTQALEPVRVSGGHLFNELIAGSGHQTCGRTGDGTAVATLYCWGLNDFGQAGLGSSVNQSFVPTQVALP